MTANTPQLRCIRVTQRGSRCKNITSHLNHDCGKHSPVESVPEESLPPIDQELYSYTDLMDTVILGRCPEHGEVHTKFCEAIGCSAKRDYPEYPDYGEMDTGHLPVLWGLAECMDM